MSKEEWISIAKGGGIAFSAFLATWLSVNVIPRLDESNTGGMLTMAFVSVVINILRKVSLSKPQ